MYRALFFGGDRPEPLSRYLTVAPPPSRVRLCRSIRAPCGAKYTHSFFPTISFFFLLLSFFGAPSKRRSGEERGGQASGLVIGAELIFGLDERRSESSPSLTSLLFSPPVGIC